MFKDKDDHIDHAHFGWYHPSPRASFAKDGGGAGVENVVCIL